MGREVDAGAAGWAEADWGFEELGSVRWVELVAVLLGEGVADPGVWGGVVANLVLQDAIERIFVQDVYADVPRGVFLVRGENVLLLGEIVCCLRVPSCLYRVCSEFEHQGSG